MAAVWQSQPPTVSAPAEPRQPVAPPHERGEGGRGGHDVGGQRDVEDDGVHPAASPARGQELGERRSGPPVPLAGRVVVEMG